MATKKLKKKKRIPAEELFLKDRLDYFPYQVFLLNKDGDNAYSSFNKEGCKIYIPMLNDFPDVLESMIHELEEVYWFIKNKRFIDTKEIDEYESINCIFIFTHDDFQKKCHFIAHKMANIFPLLFEKWMEMQPEE